MRGQGICSKGRKGHHRGLIGLWAVDGADSWTGKRRDEGILWGLVLRDCLLLLDRTEPRLLRYYSNLITVVCALRSFDQ